VDELVDPARDIVRAAPPPPSPLLDQLRAKILLVRGVAPRAYWYVWWGTLVNRLGGFVIPLLTIYLTTVRKESVADAGLAVSVFGLGQIAASIVGGQLADRVGRKATMVMSLFGGAIAMLVLGFTRDLTSITIMVGVVGFVGELYRPAVSAFIADVIPDEHRVQAYGLLHWVINIGFAFAAIVGGVVADYDFTILFIADAATMGAYGVIVLLAVPETRPARSPQQMTARPSRSWITDGPFVVFVGISFVLTLIPIQTGAPLAAHMTWQGLSPAAYGLVMGVNGLLIIAIQPLLTAWTSKLDSQHVIFAAALFYGAGMSLHGASGYIPVHALAVAIWTVGEIIESPTRSAIVAAMAPADARGRYQGAMVASWGGAFFVGPLLGTAIWEHSPGALWLGCLGVGLLVAIATAVTAPARRREIIVRSLASSAEEPRKT
jgi:MFS family permease